MALKEKPERKRSIKPLLTAPPIPLWKKPWLLITGSITALALMLTNIGTILANLRSLPNEIQMTSDQFFNWYGEYSAWKGHWSSYPEGRVDIAELELASEPFRLNIEESRYGQIVGTIETRGICNKAPYFEALLIDGSISNSRNASASVFDYVQGYRRSMATVHLRREGTIITVLPIDDPLGIFSKETRIALDPDELGVSQNLEPICPTKSEAMIKRALDKVEEPSAQR